MYGLKRIVLHNSYIRNKTSSFNTDGHHNVTGSNGAGKTSALNLIPLFYGAYPNDLVSQSSGKLSFLDYYLPTQSSALLFEHLREDGPRVVAMYRASTGERLAYRFIKGSIDETFLADALSPLRDSGAAISEMLKAIAQEGRCEVSRPIYETNHYRAILQNNTNELRTLGASHKKRSQMMAPQYCLGGPSRHMSDLDKMSHSILSRQDMFPRLQKMIVETQFSEIHEHEKPGHLNDERLLSEVQSLESFDKHQVVLEECQKFDQLRQKEHAEGRQRLGETLTAIGLAQTEATDLQRQVVAIRAKLEARQAAFDETNKQLSEKMTDLQGQQGSLRKQIKSIEQERRQWAEKGIGQQIAALHQLPNHKARLEELQQEQDILTEQHNDLVRQRDELLRHEHATQANSKQRHTAQANELLKEENSALQVHSQKRASIESSKRESLEQLDQGPEHQELTSLKEQSLLTQERGRAATISPEYQAAIDEAYADIVAGREQVSSAQRACTKAEDAASNQKTHEEGAAARLEEARATVHDLKAQRTDVEALQNPKAGTLLYELRKKDPGWTQTIGRVIRPELLHRRNLGPSFDHPPDSLYGWSLSLDKVDPIVEAADAEALIVRLEALDANIRNAQDDQADAERQLKRATELRKSLTQKATSARHDVDKAQQRLADLEDRYQRVRQQAQEDIEQRRERCEQQLLDIQHSIKELEDTLSARREQILERYRRELEQAEAEQSASLQSLKEKQTENDEALQSAEEQFRERCAELEQDFLDQMREAGVDDQRLRSLRAQTADLSKTIDRIEHSRPEINRYRYFEAEQLPQLDSLYQNRTQTDADIDKCQSEKQAAKREHKRERTELQGTLAANQRHLDKATREIKEAEESVEGAQTRFGTVEPAPNTPEDLESIVDALVACLERERTYRAQLLKKIDEVERVISHYSGTMIHEAWQSLLDQRQKATQLTRYDEAFRLSLPQDLQTLIDSHIPNIRDSMVEHVRAVGDALYRFYSFLSAVVSEARQVTNRLHRVVNTNQRIKDLSDIRLELTTRLADTEYWEPLSVFGSDWGAWVNSNRSGLPPADLLQAMSQANRVLQNVEVKTDINSLLKLRIRMVENGREAVATNSRELNDMSSNGLSYLGIIVIFIGMTRYLCPHEDIAVHWPIDELGSLHGSNIVSMFDMLNDNGLRCFSALPEIPWAIASHYNEIVEIDRTTGVRRVKLEDDIADDDPELQKLIAQTPVQPFSAGEQHNG